MLSWARCLDQRVGTTCREVSFAYYAVVKLQGARSESCPPYVVRECVYFNLAIILDKEVLQLALFRCVPKIQYKH
jgi:hypothetical protein